MATCSMDVAKILVFWILPPLRILCKILDHSKYDIQSTKHIMGQPAACGKSYGWFWWGNFIQPENLVESSILCIFCKVLEFSECVRHPAAPSGTMCGKVWQPVSTSCGRDATVAKCGKMSIPTTTPGAMHATRILGMTKLYSIYLGCHVCGGVGELQARRVGRSVIELVPGGAVLS